MNQKKVSNCEFEREPVPYSERRGLKSFVGMFAGEHCAGTELMIGPLFVAAGVGAFDVIGLRQLIYITKLKINSLFSFWDLCCDSLLKCGDSLLRIIRYNWFQ